jgi:hypothetical protein
MSLRSLWVLPLSALLLGCPPEVGNKCQLSTDCSQLGDRLCDTSQPDGYCTVFNCEPDSCPNSVCVAFNPSIDPACENANDGRYPRFERTFCMKACGDDSDCRDQYQCVNLDPNLYPNMANPAIATRGAQVVDLGAGDGGLGWSVCMVRADISTASPTGPIPSICLPPPPYDAGADGGAPWPAYDGG